MRNLSLKTKVLKMKQTRSLWENLVSHVNLTHLQALYVTVLEDTFQKERDCVIWKPRGAIKLMRFVIQASNLKNCQRQKWSCCNWHTGRTWKGYSSFKPTKTWTRNFGYKNCIKSSIWRYSWWNSGFRICDSNLKRCIFLRKRENTFKLLIYTIIRANISQK